MSKDDPILVVAQEIENHGGTNVRHRYDSDLDCHVATCEYHGTKAEGRGSTTEGAFDSLLQSVEILKARDG